jgi:hypothetical protein
MKDIYEKTPEERKLISFQNSTNSYCKALESHTQNLIRMYEQVEGYELGLKFIQESLIVIKSYDEEKHKELDELLFSKIDSDINES